MGAAGFEPATSKATAADLMLSEFAVDRHVTNHLSLARNLLTYSGHGLQRRPRQLDSSGPTSTARQRFAANSNSIYESFSVPGSGGMIFQAATANLNPLTEAKVDTKSPERGPLLIIFRRPGHTVP
jgi:hypothetical protein